MPPTPNSSSYRSLAGIADTLAIRTAIYNGEECIIVPVVMLIGNAIVRPLGSTGPEFVPEEELSIAVSQWNGRSCLPDHPENGLASANKPQTLESESFGTLFNTVYSGGRLKADAYLSRSMAENVGPLAVDVIDRCLAGEAVEVSVGAYITFDPTPGTYRGIEYTGKWTSIRSDHLALLPAGTEGACSVEMGCGAPRTMEKSKTMKNKTQQTGSNSGNPLSSLWHSFTLAIRGATGDTSGMSDSDLRIKLRRALRAIEPGFSDGYYDNGIYDVYTATQTVVYCSWPEDKLLVFSRTYNVVDNIVTVNDDRQQVEPALTYVPVGTSDDTLDSSSDDNDPVEVVIVSGADTDTNTNTDTGTGGPQSRSATGARHSAADVKSIQSIHDTSIDLGAACANTDIVANSPDSNNDYMTYADALSSSDLGDMVYASSSISDPPCSCHTPTLTATPTAITPATSTATLRSAKGTIDMPIKKEDLKSIVNRSLSGAITDADRATLKAEFGEDIIPPVAATPAQDGTTPVAAAAAAASTAPTPTPSSTIPPVTTTATEDEVAQRWLSSAPKSVRDMVTRAAAAETATRTKMIDALGKTQTEFTPAQLTLKPTDELASLCRMLSIGKPTPDYSGLGFSMPLDTISEVSSPKPVPNGWNIALKAMGKPELPTIPNSDLQPN